MLTWGKWVSAVILTEIRALHHLQVTHTAEWTHRPLLRRDLIICRAFLLVLHHRHQISDINVFTKIPESSLLEGKSRGQEKGRWQQQQCHDDCRHGCWERKRGKREAAKEEEVEWCYTVSLLPSCSCCLFFPHSTWFPPFPLFYFLTHLLSSFSSVVLVCFEFILRFLLVSTIFMLPCCFSLTHSFLLIFFILVNLYTHVKLLCDNVHG